MLTLALILIPAACGLAALVVRHSGARRTMLISVAAAHLALTAVAWWRIPEPALAGWLRFDAAGLLFLGVTSVLFLAASIYALGYLDSESTESVTDLEEGFLFTNAPEAVFTGCLLLFLSSMTLVAASRHFGLLWIAIEATTLASAPLIYFHRHHRSLEATWKYLLVCSVGIALALLGNFFLGVAGAGGGAGSSTLVLDELLGRARHLNVTWLRASFVLILVGYGTKMGLAPLHTWLPDAHSEAPSLVSALLSGALLNCAFLGIVRAQQLNAAAGEAAFGQKSLLALGVISVTVAATFVLGQGDFKRLLAYSSVEHMGILAIGLGLGGAGVFGAFFHAVNHSLVKSSLFLVSGNILSRYRTKSIRQVRGMLRATPGDGVLWIVGFLAITGTPPFGLFFSKFMVFKAAFDGGRWIIGGLLLFLLAVIFAAMARVCLGMAQGAPEAERPARMHEKLAFYPAAILAGMALLLGIVLPERLGTLLTEATRSLGVVP
jgi:hydrogenase-4 component F